MNKINRLIFICSLLYVHKILNYIIVIQIITESKILCIPKLLINKFIETVFFLLLIDKIN
jgi:hypothetical protein